MKKNILYLILSFQISQAHCQDNIGLFLNGFNQEENVDFLNQKIQDMNMNSYKLPYLEKIEFRSETNEFDLRKQEYLFRISPNSIESIKSQKKYQESVKYMTEMEKEAAISEALHRRYDLVVAYVFQKKLIAIKRKQQLLLKDKVTLLKRSISLQDFDIMELIDAEDKAQENNRELMDLENNTITIQNTIQEKNHSHLPINLDSTSIISISTIKANLSKFKPTKTANHPILKVQSAKAYNNLLAHELETAKSKISLSYFQTKYSFDPSPDNTFKKNFAIGFGFEIPFKNKSRLELNELKINVLESESQYRDLKSRLIEQKFSNFYKLNNLLDKYELVSQQIKEGQAEYVLREYQKIAETPPKAFIKLRENTLRKELLLEELAYEIMLNYIAFIAHTGLLAAKPIKNYLQEGQSILGN